MKRLLLIAPVSHSSLFGRNFFFRLPGLGLLRVVAMTPPDWEVRVVDEKVESLDMSLEADLVGITTMTCTAPRAYEIADHFRQRNIKVVMGGMHVSALPEEALQHCDSVVVGEAEGLWPAVLKDHESQQLKKIYRHENGLPPLVNYPQADWDRYRGKDYLPVHFVETTRGCPLDCEFCAVTTAFGGQYRNRPQEEVIAELRSLKPFDGLFTLKNCVFFVDDNIISNKAYARALLPQLREFKLKWFSHASMNIAKDTELLRLCQESGCVGLFVGFESLSQETLQSVGKRTNRPQEYMEVVQRIHDHGIGIDAAFVFGFDSDDEGVFDRTLEFVVKAKVEVPYFSILTPYPGTRLHQRLRAENRLLSRDWSRYDMTHVVYKPARLTPDQLLEGHCRVMKESYSWGNIFRRMRGAQSYKNFFYPMNFGFRQGANKLYKACRAGDLK